MMGGGGGGGLGGGAGSLDTKHLLFETLVSLVLVSLLFELSSPH